MILVFGGTTEGRKAVEVLEEAGSLYCYSTRSDGQQVELLNGIHLTGKMEVTEEVLHNYSMESGSEDRVIAMKDGKLSYRWLADNVTACLKMANILYNDKYRGNYQLNWDYEDFQPTNRKFYPMEQRITFTTPDQEVKLGLTYSYIGKEENWETRTEISSKYRQVSVEEILQRFMSL